VLVLRTLSIRSLAAIVLSFALASCTPAESSPKAAAPMPEPHSSLFAHPWRWTDEQGTTVALSQWGGQPIVVAAVYTTCTRTCPLTVRKMRNIHEAFERAGRPAQFVLVSLDPDVDTPERLRRFKEERHLPSDWHLLTGKRSTTLEILDLLGIHVLDMDAHVFHDSKIVVFDEHGAPARSFDCCDFDPRAALL
jgi:protein SCO1/2